MSYMTARLTLDCKSPLCLNLKAGQFLKRRVVTAFQRSQFWSRSIAPRQKKQEEAQKCWLTHDDPVDIHYDQGNDSVYDE
jgi:hypothetical protein